MRERLWLAVAAALLVIGWTGLAAEEAVPRFAEVTAHDFGDRITLHHEMAGYVRRLAETSPRVAMEVQGYSWEGRALVLAIVTSPENHARLDEIRANAVRLADPRRTDPDAAEEILATQPAIVWMGGSIHGFELSGAEGLLKLLERLSTADDAETLEVLDNAVVLIDPMINPDGRDAFGHRNHENIGREPSPERDDWANDFSFWQALKFRTGHYYFDTNRDWFAHTQRETRSRVPTLVAWRPQIVIDAHEMGADVEFYFDPAAEPYGPFFPEFARRWFERFNAVYAEAFDSAGFEYMTRERYNYFYPGYTTSFGSYQGAVGMLYEQGSSRGLALRRADDSVRSLRDALEQQYTAAWTAARSAAGFRTELLRDYYEAGRAALAEGATGIRRYLLPPGGDPGLREELIGLLLRNGVEVDRTLEPARLDGLRGRDGAPAEARELPAGTYVVEAAQPLNRLVRALLEPQVPIPEDFLAEARARVDRGRNPRFYDITAWSLPLLFNVPAFGTTDGRSLALERVTTVVDDAASPEPERAGYAYLLPGEQAGALAALSALKRDGYRAAVTLKPSRLAGRDLAAGTVVLRVGQNADDLHDAVTALAGRYDLEVVPVATGLAEPGFPSLGSGDVIPVKDAEIALLAEGGVHAYSFGWAWYTLDRQYGVPVTVRRTGSIAATPVDRFNVIVVPDLFSADAVAAELGEGGRARLDRWVRDGGTLVVIGEAVDLAAKHLELVSIEPWYERQAKDKGGGESSDDEPSDDEPQRFRVPGALLRAELDPEVWLSAGSPAELPALVNSDRIYLAPTGPPQAGRQVAARYAPEDSLMSGHAWPESLERLPGAVLVYEERVGRGRVIAFVEDPNFRAYWRGANRLFLNAVLLGPSAP